MARIPTAIVLIALLSASCPPGAEAEVPFDVGGPCQEEGASDPVPFAKMRQAAEAEDWDRLIELEKQSVRGMCSNHYRWFSLASAYLRAGQIDAAIEVLSEAHRRGARIVGETFARQPDLLALVGSDPFRESPLGRELARLRATADTRRADYQRRLAALGDERPPTTWVAHGACPFECCTYREWGVVRSTVLYDRPGSSNVVGTAEVGARVRALTGEVHLRPAALAVVHDHAPLVAGEIVFLLDTLGEGFSRYWRAGQVHEIEITPAERCLRPGPSCWVEHIEPSEARIPATWWVHIETPAGVRGWTSEPAHFDDKDACG